MRKTAIALAVLLTSAVHTARGADVPVSASSSAIGSTSVIMARWTPSDHSDDVPGSSEPVLPHTFPLRPKPVPIPHAKPWAWKGSATGMKAAKLPPEKACGIIEAAARTHQVPVGFLTRLIWSESRFHAGAVSPAGAQGIAQFMPATAAERGLKDPFDPEQSLAAAASLLSRLKQRFGNFGLAAAAYNAGPTRVSDWLGKKRRLPEETRNYVKAVTGRSARKWAALARSSTADAGAGEEAKSSCIRTAFALAGYGR